MRGLPNRRIQTPTSDVPPEEGNEGAGVPQATNELAVHTSTPVEPPQATTAEPSRATAPDDRILIYPSGHRLHDSRHHDSGIVSRHITRIFRQRWFPEGHQWKALSADQISFYFEEFKKYCRWDPCYSDQYIRTIFESHAAIRYSDSLTAAKRKRHVTMKDDVWAAWNRKWSTPEAKELSKKYKANRLSAPSGQDGPVKHTGGSRSAYKLKRDMAEKLGRDPSIPELHVVLHTNKDDHTKFIDQKSKDVHDRYMAEREHVQQSQHAEEGSSSTSVIDENELFLSLDGVKGNRIYGIGTASSSYQISAHQRRRPSTSSQEEQTPDDRLTQMRAEMQAEMEAKLKAQAEAHEAQLQAEREARMQAQQAQRAEMDARLSDYNNRYQMQAEAHARMQAQMQGYIERFVASLPPEHRPRPLDEEHNVPAPDDGDQG